jgi:hypothetical protein
VPHIHENMNTERGGRPVDLKFLQAGEGGELGQNNNVVMEEREASERRAARQHRYSLELVVRNIELHQRLELRHRGRELYDLVVVRVDVLDRRQRSNAICRLRAQSKHDGGSCFVTNVFCVFHVDAPRSTEIRK